MAEPQVSSVETGARFVYRDRQLIVERTDRPSGLRFVGEIDISNSNAIGRSLLELVNGSPWIHLDVRSLVFCDISGMRALVNSAQALGPDRRLLVHGLAPELERVVRLVGWLDEPGLSFCGCAEVEP